MSALRALYARFGRIIHELAKFGVIGAIGFIIDFGLFNVFHYHAKIGVITSNTLSSTVAAVFTYVGNRFWSFRHQEKGPVRREVPIFVVLNVIGLAITDAFVGFTDYVLDDHSKASANIAKLIGTAVATVFRFATYKKFVFVGGPTSSDEHAVEVFEGEAVVQV